jgi:hypothetical protein
MNTRVLVSSITLGLASLALASMTAAAEAPIPHLVTENGRHALLVDQKRHVTRQELVAAPPHALGELQMVSRTPGGEREEEETDDEEAEEHESRE